MFLIIMIIILGWCVMILWSMYYNTIAIQRTYGNTNAYYWAYYGAMASIERWLLMSKLKYPTYEGSWWFKWDTIIWSNSNWFADEFRKLNQWNNSMIRYINSKTTSISSYIDTKTLRTISFYQYQDNNLDSFSSNGITGSVYWVTQWLAFSWHTEPSKWERQTTNLKEVNMDFNRFFWLNKSGWIVRSLWYNFKLDQQNLHDEKDYPLSWDFRFLNDEINPRPAESWDLSSEYTIWIHDQIEPE